MDLHKAKWPMSLPPAATYGVMAHTPESSHYFRHAPLRNVPFGGQSVHNRSLLRPDRSYLRNQSGRLDARDGGSLVVVRGVAGDADGPDQCAGGVLDEHAAGDRH